MQVYQVHRIDDVGREQALIDFVCAATRLISILHDFIVLLNAMSVKKILKIVFTVMAVIFFKAVPASQYAGSDACFACHAEQYNDFRVSGHPHKLMKADEARHRPVPLPEGYTWNDISYVIGGVHKKIRYLDKQGYIITGAKDGSELKTQYNLETGTWAFYHKGEKKPYTCGSCHTTGYVESGNQNSMPGIKGRWFAPGVQCEACHGPGLEHSKSGDRASIKVDRSSAACGECHMRGRVDMIPAQAGFIRHHQQFNELQASAHKAINCVTCHNPHKRAAFSIKMRCESCHSAQLTDYRGSTMHKRGVSCIDCHMPQAVKSATHESPVKADVRSHLMSISTTNESMFFEEKVKENRQTFAKNFISVDFACLTCHKDKSFIWAREKAKNIHRAGK